MVVRSLIPDSGLCPWARFSRCSSPLSCQKQIVPVFERAGLVIFWVKTYLPENYLKSTWPWSTRPLIFWFHKQALQWIRSTGTLNIKTGTSYAFGHGTNDTQHFIKKQSSLPNIFLKPVLISVLSFQYDLLIISSDLITTLPLHYLTNHFKAYDASFLMLISPLPESLNEAPVPGVKVDKQNGQ